MFILGHEIIILWAKLRVAVDDAFCQGQRTEGLDSRVRFLAPSNLPICLPHVHGKEVRCYCHFTDVMIEAQCGKVTCSRSQSDAVVEEDQHPGLSLPGLFCPSDGLREY